MPNVDIGENCISHRYDVTKGVDVSTAFVTILHDMEIATPRWGAIFLTKLV